MSPATDSTHNNELIYDAKTEVFSETPTIVGGANGSSELSVFSLPTQIFPVDQQQETIKSSKTQAPKTDNYTITHEISFGGYGAIWNGIQKSLNRRVALKSLKAEVANSPQFEKLARLFRQEAITMAYLQHPNVVPIYDLTSGEDGHPILAMKLVEGRQWNRVLAEDFNKLSPLEFLEQHIPVLISIGQAVAYAHSRGIIHRDLKPSQVMINSYGEVLLMDWGLAMASRDPDGQVVCDPAIIIDAQSSLVKPLAPAGTPSYMAPEQTGRDASKLGPWTDVYLLGAILYEVLTGMRPHQIKEKSNGIALPKDNNIIPPEERTPDRDIPGQLSKLAMKAMQSRPSTRIPSASAFVKELKDYLIKAARRGESMTLVTSVANFVLAEEHTYDHLQSSLDKLDKSLALWPENRMAEYLRHQVLATFARTALSQGDLKLAQYQAERIELDNERKTLLTEIAASERKMQMKDAQIREAHTEAREERNRAESIVQFLLLDLHTELRSVGRADLVHKVATQALRFFDSLKEDETNRSTLHNRCTAYRQIGTVLSEQGKRDEAETAYSRALAITQVLISGVPENIEWKLLKAACLNDLGQLHYTMGRLDVAAQEYSEALALRKNASELLPKDRKITCQINSTIHNIGLILWRTQKFDEALKKVDKALESARESYKSNPTDIESQSNLAEYLVSRGNILRDKGDLAVAIQTVYEALALRIALSDQFPGNFNRSNDVLWVRSNLSMLLMSQGGLESALDNLRQDVSLRRRVLEEDSTNVFRTMGLTFHLSLMAEVSFVLSRTEETERLLAECLVYSLRLSEQDKSNPTALARYALHLCQLAELQISKGKWEEGERTARQAMDQGRLGYWQSTDNTAVSRPLVQILALVSRLENRAGNDLETLQLAREAEQMLSQLKENPNSSEHHALEARLYMGDQEKRPQIIEQLKRDRRFDPYLKAWADESIV